MKKISQQQAIVRLTRITERLRDDVVSNYEHRAKSCLRCETPGACCLDEHFVNVRISRLEAIRIARTLGTLPTEVRQRVTRRIDASIRTYALGDDSESTAQAFACPLFEAGSGCLVHNCGKPIPCIMHACYEDPGHLPPDTLKDKAELAVERLNALTYNRPEPLLPIPVAIKTWAPIDAEETRP